MKTAVLITARLKSERLPRKAMLPLMGRPMICHLIDRMKAVPGKPEIVLCTSVLESDDLLAELARHEGIGCFRGDPEDVLARLAGAARSVGAEAILSVTGDNPLTDPAALGELARFRAAGDYDYCNTTGLPWGAFGYAVTGAALARACEIKSARDTEVWGGYFTQTGEFRCGTLAFDDPSVHWPELRVTVDTEADFALVRAVFGALYRPGEIFGIERVVAHCRSHRALIRLNAHVVQKPGAPIRVQT